jgi:AcrR family transcriptional regulator
LVSARNAFVDPMTEPTRPRHRPELGYARGDQTRRRIVDAAIQLFGLRGYEGASTRDIARLAGVNAPALQYYFDGKEGLYRACAEHIAGTMAAHFEPALQAAEATLARDAGREELIEAYLRLQDVMAEHLLASSDAQDRRRFATHEQVGNGPGMLLEILDAMRPRLMRPSTAIVARLTGRREDDPLTLVRVLTLHGQLAVFHLGQRQKLDLIALPDDAQRFALIREVVRAQTRAVIGSWEH